MKIILALLAIAAIVGVLYAIRYLLRFVFYEMAKDNILFTLRTEGEIKAIMEGDRCVRYVMAVQNHMIDPDDFDIFKGSPKNLRSRIAELIKIRKEKITPPSKGKPNSQYDPSFVEKKLVEVTDSNREELIRSGGEDEIIKDLVKDGEGKNHEYALEQTFRERLLKANPVSEEDRHWVERWFGVVWIGFPPFRVFIYNFRWIKYSQKRALGGVPSMEIAMHARDEDVDSLYFRYPTYDIVIADAETGAGSVGGKLKKPKEKGRKGAEPPPSAETGETEEEQSLERIQLKLELVMETETVNPQKTLFRTAGLSSAGDWLSAISKEIRELVRPWVGEKEIRGVV